MYRGSIISCRILILRYDFKNYINRMLDLPFDNPTARRVVHE